FHYLRQYKSRTLMTMFGIIWGTVTVVVLLAFGVGVKASMSKNMHGMGEGIAILWPGRTSLPFQGYGSDRWLSFREEDAELLRAQINLIEAISPEYSRWGTPVRVGEQVIKPNISGIIPEYGPMRNVLPQPGGRWLNELDLRDRKRVVFLGYKLKEFLFGKDREAIGEYVFIGEAPFLVVGILAEKTQPSSYSARDQDRAFIPATTFASLFGHRYINNMVYKPKDPRFAQTVQDRIYEVLGKKYKFDPKDKQALSIWDTSEMDKFIFYFSLGINIFLGLIGALTLTVGGIGLANIMYVVVQERTREIGIRRSVGAKRRQVMGQFILEAFIIIGIGAAIGFALSFILIKLISLLPIEEYVGHPTISLPVAFVSIAILSIIGFLAGYFPSRKAARLNVVECLRY
ncbi:MAG: ABC transporter permease, partial [candidate division KSB1 bacterium]|nr:ABC transporter permease [candidate division KSB1 bacterium]